MKLSFTKMHGNGNDFIIINCIHQKFTLTKKDIKRIANRNLGIGFDQLLVVENHNDPGIDFKYRIFNSDGSEVSQCGNGARCFAKYISEKKISNKKILRVKTFSGIIELKLLSKKKVQVDMGVPIFENKLIPFTKKRQSQFYDIFVNKTKYKFVPLSLGNPHTIIFVKNVDKFPILKIGSLIENHKFFPQKTNVGFVEKKNDRLIKIRVWERGVGETLSCGSGACAGAVVSILYRNCKNDLIVETSGGHIQIKWDGMGKNVRMIGEANLVFEGIINIKNL